MLVVSGLMYPPPGGSSDACATAEIRSGRDQALQGRGPWGRARLFKIISTAVLFIVLAVCYAVSQSNPDSLEPSHPIKD
jgi:hypothetical protein